MNCRSDLPTDMINDCVDEYITKVAMVFNTIVDVGVRGGLLGHPGAAEKIFRLKDSFLSRF